MRVIVALVVGLAGLAAAKSDYGNLGSMDMSQKQMVVMKLLNRVMEPVMYKEIEEIGKSFKFEDNKDCFLKPEVVKGFVNMVQFGLLPRGEIFTLYVDRQLKETVTMFYMLYYAKDFATFIKTACWMRLNVNEGMFVYALTVACRHRDDCKGIVLPAPYEIYPYYFVRGDVIQKAYLLKMKQGLLDKKLCDFYGIKKTENNAYVIDENVYDNRVYLNDEDKLRYFTEDIDLNTYYYYFHADYPFWMNEQMYGKVRGYELTLYMYQQILARYYMERLSVGLGSIPELSFNKPIKNGYWPWLMLHNGVEVPVRFNNYLPVGENDANMVRLIEDYETIIREAIMKGYVEMNGMRLELNKPEDIEVLGKLIYSTVDKVDEGVKCVEAYRYLLIIMKSVLGLNTLESDKYFVVPSALQSYQTALRDPLFYQLQKRLIDFVYLFKKRLPCYTKEELYFPGVKVENVVVDKLITYFDEYLMDMSNAVVLNEEEMKKTSSDMNFFVRKIRLNHQPFKVSVDVMSDKSVDCVVRMFLGPKEDQFGNMLDINDNRINFVEIDSFVYKLTGGKNTITRKSGDMNNLVPDRIMTRDMFTNLETIRENKLPTLMKNHKTGFPTRLLLPRGKAGGMKMLLYVIVSPLRMMENADLSMFESKNCESCMNCRWAALLDKMPLGFPLDREIDVPNFYTSNMKFVDVMIFHKKQTCDMKMRWDRWVLRDYNLMNRTPMQSETYSLDNEMNMKTNSNQLNYQH